jgi:hypothetical protein
VQVLLETLKDELKSQRRYPGLKVFEEGKSFIPIENIPGVLEAGWRPEEEQDVVAQIVGMRGRNLWLHLLISCTVKRPEMPEKQLYQWMKTGVSLLPTMFSL